MTASHLSNTTKTPFELESDPSSNERKVLSIERATSILKEYLTYDAKNSQQMCGFIAQYPWVLEDPLICLAIVSDPKCYNTLKQYDWWDQAKSHVENPDSLTNTWLREHHVMALAYETSDAELERLIDWPSWETLIQEHGPMHQLYDGDPDSFYRTRAFVVLANRLGTDLAPLMCAAMHILLPFDALQNVVGDAWTPLQKSQFAWLIEKTGVVSDIWPTEQRAKSVLDQAQKDLGQWKALVHPAELAGLAAVYDLNNSDLDETIYNLIQFAQFKAPTESLDYTMALGASSS